ncbi:MAG: hypothetical protein JO089_02965, partial [Alphaproteobacteria bacterium]|nr:hypothetical protein [Alphaproteobacteria bacterium]
MKLPAPVFRLLSRLPRPKGRKINRRKLSSFILTVGDEGAVLLQVVRGEIVSRFFSPAHNAKETGAFVDAVMEAPRLPLIILFDTLDQAYVQQTLPPVAAMSVSRLMRKRLQREFPSDYLKGALLLGREKEKRRDWIFLMAALQNTASVQAWLDMAAEWPNRCKGIYLTPLEAVAVARALDIARPVQGDRWHLLVSYNKVSGVRQIVYKNGQLVLTRLGHPAYESNAEAVAGAIEQEIIGTREYIKRLMAQAGSELTVTIIVSDDIRRHIDRGKLGVGQLQLLTPFEAAEALNFPTAAQSADRFGDIVLAVGIASAPKHLLKFVAPLMQRQNQYHTAIRMVRAATVCAALGLLALAGTSAWSIVVSGKAISALEERQQSVTAELQKSREKAA